MSQVIRIFKDIKLKYYITQFIGIVILLCLNYYIYQKNHSITLCAILIFTTIIYILFTRIIYKSKVRKRLADLSNKTNNTNIQETITTYEEIILKTNNQKLKTELIIKITELYIKIGETKKALQLYKDFEPIFSKNITGKLNQIIYLNNICQICIREKLYSLAEENLKIIKRLSKIEDYNKETKDKINKIYNDLVIELIFKKNKIKDYNTIEKYYLKRFEEETDNSKKVFFAYQLIKVYKKLKNKEEEKKYKEFYIKNKEELNYN